MKELVKFLAETVTKLIPGDGVRTYVIGIGMILSAVSGALTHAFTQGQSGMDYGTAATVLMTGVGLLTARVSKKP